MSFTNLQLEIDELPKAESINWRRLDPSHPRQVVTELVTIMGSVFLIPALVLLVIIKGWAMAGAVSGIVAGAGVVLTGGAAWLAYAMARAYRIAIREHDFAIKKGLMWRTTIFVLLSRVQHVEVTQGVFERRFKLATLKLFTAGGAQADLKIPGLPRAEAMNLRQQVMAVSELAQPGEINNG